MVRSVSTTTILNVFKVFVYFQVALFITLTRGYFISTSSFRLTLFVTVLVLTFLSPAHAEKDLSLFEFFLTILTSTSSFVISESPVIVILILTDSSLISNIKPWLERFLVNPSSLGTSNNIGLESNGSQALILPEIPTDMIGEIENRIHIKDIKAILTFCNPCSSACFETTTWSLFPWLMLSNKLDTDLQCFFNLCNNKYLWLELPTSDQKRCWGSPHGLVVTLGPDYEAYLVHVRKEDQIALPPLNPIRALAQLEEWFRLVHKFIILKDPSHELLFLVFAIFGPVNRLAFARVAFNRGGDGAALNRRGQAEVQNIEPQTSAEEIGTPQKLYLMKSQKNLIAVFRYREHNPKKMRQETKKFLVYNFNFSASNWEVTDLEDCTAFVGDGNSWCIPTSTIPSRNNCIYFTDDNWELQMYPGVAYGGRDVGVFNIAQRKIQQLPVVKDNPRYYSRPNWVTPSSYAFT
nr:hypothetical protein CFP56_07031 [Quercus suber]